MRISDWSSDVCSSDLLALWSNYAGSGDRFRFVRVGTLDDPDRLPPDIHIFTASKQPWLNLPEGALAFEEYYDRESCWPAESLARRRAHLGGRCAAAEGRTRGPEGPRVRRSSGGEGRRSARPQFGRA